MVTKQFVTAGRAVFTVENNQHQHYTFRVNRKQADTGYNYFISVRTGSVYTYMGMMFNDKCQLTAKSHFAKDSTSVRVFNWAMRVINGLTPLPADYAIHHEGTCGRCGKPLTDPESIRIGLGPYCRTK